MCLLHAKVQYNIFCCFRDPELQFLHRGGAWWAVGWWNTYSGLALQVGHTLPHNWIIFWMVTQMLETLIVWPFLQGSHFSEFLEVQLTATFHQVWQIKLLSTALHCSCKDSKLALSCSTSATSRCNWWDILNITMMCFLFCCDHLLHLHLRLESLKTWVTTCDLSQTCDLSHLRLESLYLLQQGSHHLDV